MRKTMFLPRALAVVCAALLFTCCEKVEDDEALFEVTPSGNGLTPVTPSNPTDEPTDEPADRQENGIIPARYASRLELASMAADDRFVAHYTLENDAVDTLVNYCVAYSTAHHHARWVAFRFDATNRAVNVERKAYTIKPQYPIDPDLQDVCLPSDASFATGYDHGHLVASNDRRTTREQNDQTFYMSNMSPQLSSFNSNYWTVYETFVQTLGRSAAFADTLYVVKGGTLDEVRESIVVEGFTVPVPKYYWIALLRQKGSSYAAIGFWMEHRSDYASVTASAKNAEILAHAVTIDDLEQRTGIDFFTALPDDVETTVEAAYQSTTWGL